MVKFKCKVMLCVLSYFILNFIFVYSFDIENDHYIQKRYLQQLKGVCDVRNEKVSFNYNELYKIEGYTVKSDNKIFFLNICGYAPQCGGNIAVCYQDIKNKVNIGTLKDMSFPHEALRYKIGKRTKTKIHFICDRHVNANEPNITYEEKTLYSFKFKTPRACYQKPTQCLFTSDKYTYNISSLYRKKNNWLVKNVQNVPNNSHYDDYKIYLNICGQFNSIPNLNKNSDCNYKGSQICLVYNNGSSKNLGVFSDPIQVDDDSFSVSLSVTGGSLCNGSNTITTNIEFICSFEEFGPVLVSNSECEYNMNWMTPAVCPHQVLETSNTCELTKTIFGSRKMKLKMQSIKLNASILKYNICDPITCNGDKNAHFCLVNITNNQETIIGRSNGNKLISTDGLLTTTYHGDSCTSKNKHVKSRVNVKFNCDYTRNKQADVAMSEDGCTTNVTIHSNEACTDPEPKIIDGECSTFTNISGVMHYYNISRLMLTDRNYEIRDPTNPNLVYILNVCQPILFRPGTNCDQTTIVCMRNDSVPNIYHRSKSLGHRDSSKITVLQNDSVLIQFEGNICLLPNKNHNNYQSSIEFICNYEAKDSQPTLVSNTDCEYYFKWETQYACPLTKNDTLQIKTETKSNASTSEIKVKMKDTQSYASSTIPATPTTSTSSTTSSTVSNVDVIVHNVEVVTEAQILPTSLVVPINVSNTTGLFIRNCTFEDFNMYTLPRNIQITSKTGKQYSLSICNLSKNSDCKFGNCLSQLKVNASSKSIEMDFHGEIKCENGYYNSVIYMICSEISSQPSVIKEEACSVELEWKNSAACALQEKPKIPRSHPIDDELTLQKSGHITAIIITVIILLIILCASVFISIYFWRKRQAYNSPSCLNRCDYSRVKDSAKIV